MADRLSADLLARIKVRAGSAAARSDDSSLAAESVGTDDLLAGVPKSKDPAVRDYLEGMNTPFAGMISNLVTGDGKQAKGLLGALGGLMRGKMMMGFGFDGKPTIFGGSGASAPAAPPASEAEIVAAEAKLDFALPRDLRHYYLEVANGGVGPGDGVFSLKQLIAKHRELTKEPVGPQGQDWPANLLPIQGEDWDLVAIDRDTGKLIFWEVEDLTDAEDDPDNVVWNASFVAEADSLEAWLDKWLRKPTAAEKAKRRAERPAPQQLTDEDWRAWEAKSPLHREYSRRLEIFTMTAAERAAIGLPAEGWEDKVWEGLDLTKIKPPMPGFAEREARKN